MNAAQSTGDPPGYGLTIGQRVGNYRVTGVLGRGGMATVFHAVHERIGKRAAIKVLSPDLSLRPEMVTRFLNEARAVNIVQHPGIVDIFEFGTLESGTAYIAMDYLEGELLSARLQRAGGLPAADALRLGRQIAAALQAAHEKGIVHRDLKPANVMIVRDPDVPEQERAKLLDFGIAKLAPGDEGEVPRTETGLLMGTPAYMAPEQCRRTGVATDRVDVYALGVILYQMLAGQPPFRAGSAFDLMSMHVYQTPPPLRRLCPGHPEELTALVHRMLSKEPERRPAMTEVADHLGRLAAGRELPAPAARRPGPGVGLWVGALGAALLLGGAAYLGTRERGPEIRRAAAGGVPRLKAPPAAPPAGSQVPEARAPQRPSAATRAERDGAAPQAGTKQARPAGHPAPGPRRPRNEDVALMGLD